MNISQENNKELSAIHKRFAIVFCLLLLFTAIVTSISTYLSRKIVYLEEERAYDFAKNEIVHGIHTRILAYHTTLRGLSAFFQSTNEVTIHDWANYVKNAELLTYFPGISAFGFTQFVPHTELAAYTAKMKKTYSNFETNANHDEYHYIVTYVEPYLGREKSIGFDQSTELARKSTIEAVRDSGKIDNSPLISLVTSKGKGFFLAAPVYAPNAALGSVEQRRRAFRGAVFATFREDQPFTTILSDEKLYKDFDIEIYNDDSLAEDSIMYDSDPSTSARQQLSHSKFSEVIPIHLEENNWTLVLATKSSFGLSQTKKLLTWIPIAAFSIFVVVLTCLFSIQQVYLHRKLMHGKLDHQTSSD